MTQYIDRLDGFASQLETGVDPLQVSQQIRSMLATAQGVQDALTYSLRSYVSGDDGVLLDRRTFLTYVRDRIDDDLRSEAP